MEQVLWKEDHIKIVRDSWLSEQVHTDPELQEQFYETIELI